MTDRPTDHYRVALEAIRMEAESLEPNPGLIAIMARWALNNPPNRR